MAANGGQLFNAINQRDSIIAQRYNEIAKKIAASTKEDSISMSTFTFITALFLPGTFLATFFSITMIDWQPQLSNNSPSANGNGNGAQVSKYYWVFWAVDIPLTILVMLGWYLWFHRAKKVWVRDNGIMLGPGSKNRLDKSGRGRSRSSSRSRSSRTSSSSRSTHTSRSSRSRSRSQDSKEANGRFKMMPRIMTGDEEKNPGQKVDKEQKKWKDRAAEKRKENDRKRNQMQELNEKGKSDFQTSAQDRKRNQMQELREKRKRDFQASRVLDRRRSISIRDEDDDEGDRNMDSLQKMFASFSRDGKPRRSGSSKRERRSVSIADSEHSKRDRRSVSIAGSSTRRAGDDRSQHDGTQDEEVREKAQTGTGGFSGLKRLRPKSRSSRDEEDIEKGSLEAGSMRSLNFK